MTSRDASPQSRQQIADALEYQLGDDDLPGVWRLNALDVRTVIEALRSESAPKDRHPICATDGCELLIPRQQDAAPQMPDTARSGGNRKTHADKQTSAVAASYARCVEDAIEALWAYSEELHIQCNTPEASRIEGIIHNLNHLSPAHAETSLSKLMKPELAKAFGNKPDAATPNKNDLSPIEWQAILDALEFTDSKASLVSDAHERAQVKVTALCRQFERGSE